MFTDNTIRSISVADDAEYVGALVAKLVDIDKVRIHSNDNLVLRKAVFGLIEVVAVLEQRLAALEPQESRQSWTDTLRKSLDASTPDQVRLGE